MIYGATVRSSVPRGRVVKIEFGEGIPWDEFVVVSARDIPGENVIALINKDWPCLVSEQVNHPEEPILLLGHRDRHLLPKAVAAVRIEYETLPSVHSIEESERGDVIVWGEDNIFKKFLIHKGDVDAAWNQADFIVEGEYTTGAQEHLYIENNGVIAAYTPEEGLTIWGSMQCPYYVHKSLVGLTRLPEDKVRIIQVETGGAFGGKEDYPSMIGAHAALLAMKSGRPVKIMYDRLEDMVATTKRHPSRSRIRTAVSKDGKLLAADIDFALDGGAYSTLSPTVLSRGTIHAGGPYCWPNIRVRSKAFATNCPPHGAFRGFGAPQSLFAIERHMDRVAEAIGMAPEELRRRNFLHKGLTTATGQEIREDVDLEHLLSRALELSDYYAKRERFDRENPGAKKKKGIGIAAFLHGSGFTGSGERYLNSVAAVDATAEGKVRVLVSSTEFGQGTNTILCQIAAEALRIDYEAVEIVQPDTSMVPNTGPTVASRTTMIVGKLVHSAAIGLQQTLQASGLLGESWTTDEFSAAAKEYIARHGRLYSSSRYEPPPNVYWDDVNYRGEAYPAFAWAVYVAEVTVDMVTYGVTVDDFVAVQEVGRVLNPVLATGQIEGGVAQGIGYALYEKVQWEQGRMRNGQMTNYIIPTSQDIPPIRVFFEEIPFTYGAYGAKGIGELPMDGPAPAIVNAVSHATGEDFNGIPLLPEDICLRLRFSHAVPTEAFAV
ncbi:xanthine dehydrogenase family protein [Alloacidobacterium dinghuense]|uniref:Xanthine dehydrogenase family protein n=2 Tax=Alloacidobacterium dinghuense TaxID=2763107 RepID=A0A7G8BQC3_9BACT|nr:xanthine dehydrogenase family protein [Alloacidobacterium dinghuense]